MKLHTAYLRSIYESPERYQQTMGDLQRLMNPVMKEFDAIAFRGTSGAAAAYPMALLNNKSLLCVRKNDGNHSYHGVEGIIGPATYAIVDDFVASGDTLREIIHAVGRAYADEDLPPPKLTHVFLYVCNNDRGSVLAQLPRECAPKVHIVGRHEPKALTDASEVIDWRADPIGP